MSGLPEQSEMYFDGDTYDHERDGIRLSGLMLKVYSLMKDNRWRTIPQICGAIQANSEASVSARLRDLRKDRFGNYEVERKHLGNGMWTYRIVPESERSTPRTMQHGQ